MPNPIFEHAPNIMLLVDHDMQIMDINRAGERVLGKNRAELKGLRLNDVFHCRETTCEDASCMVPCSECPLPTMVAQVFASRKPVHDVETQLTVTRSNGARNFTYTASAIFLQHAESDLVLLSLTDITAWKLTEKAFLESEANYRLLVENHKDLLVKVDLDGHFLFVSPSYCELFGKTEKELLGSQFMPLVHEQDRESTAKAMAKLFLPPHTVSLEQRAMTRHGWRYLSWSDKAVLNDKGQVTAIVGVGRDITEWKQTEESLRESEQRFSKAFSSSPAPLVISDIATGNFIDVNARWIEMLEYSREEQIGRTSKEVGIWDQPEERDRIVQKLVKNGFFKDQPIRFRTRSGKIIMALWSAELVLLSGREVMLSMIYDETERKQTEEALRESEDRLTSVMTAINDGIWDWDVRKEKVFFDARYFTMAGYAQNEFPHAFEEWEKRIHPDDLEHCRNQIQDHINGKSLRLDMEFRFLKKNGEWLWIRGRGSVVRRDEEGRPLRLVGTHTDITDRKQAELEREKLQVQLIQAQKMESVGTLAGGVAHDFNNLLQAMSGNIQMLMTNKDEDHPDLRRLRTVAKSIDRAAHLVRQLLLFSRKAENKRTRVDLNHEVAEAVIMLERTIPRMVRIDQYLEQEVWPIHVDPVQIEQVLLNLGLNAADAMPEGGRLILETGNVRLDTDFVRMHMGAKPGRHVLLTVSDTGVGMDRETVAQIFDPFFTTKGVGKGTGLGLASVYGIVKAHDGYILCYSEIGRGTSFKIYWPAMDEDEQGCSVVRETEAAALEGGTETILVVDDEADIRELTAEALESFGYSVLVAGTGEEALAMYADTSTSIDMVILDLSMPGMGGHQCLRELLVLDPKARVLIASGYSANGLAKESIQAGAAGFIGKPYQITELLGKVREILQRR